MTRVHGSRKTRPLRRLQRWIRHTPNATIALNLLALGLALVVIATIMAVTLL